jgi:hypothetical protein
MDVFSMELGIRLSFVKTSEFRWWVEPPNPPWYATVLRLLNVLVTIAKLGVVSVIFIQCVMIIAAQR